MIQCNILITSGGRRVSLVRLFQEALVSLDIKGKVYSVDSKQDAPVSQISDGFWVVPRITDDTYVACLLEICVANKITLIVPTIDTELHVLAEHRKRFSDINVTLLISSQEVNKIAFDKFNTQSFFLKNHLPCPKAFTLGEAKALTKDGYPLLLKPATGSSSVGVTVLRNVKELIFFAEYIENPIIQEFVDGKEYTFDVLVGFDGNVKCIVPRLRLETRAGEVSKSVTVDDERLIGYAKQFVNKLTGVVGCITLQGFYLADGSFKFIEMNPRFGGGFPLSASAGANFPRWIIQMLLNIPEDTHMQEQWESDVLMLRYDEEIIVKLKSKY